MSVSVSEEILDFLTGIYVKRGTANRNQAIFDEAFRKAYKDMSTHTVAYASTAKDKYFYKDCSTCNENKNKIIDVIKTYVYNEFINLSNIATQQEFESWHRVTCDKIVNINTSISGLIDKNGVSSAVPIKISDIICHKSTLNAQKKKANIRVMTVFSYGQAQKLVNMMLKYLYIYSKCEASAKLDVFKPWFHCPVDRYVLKAALGKEDYNGTPWSKIRFYDEYKEIQKAIRVGINQRYSGYATKTAFEWELCEWPFK